MTPVGHALNYAKVHCHSAEYTWERWNVHCDWPKLNNAQ